MPFRNRQNSTTRNVFLRPHMNNPLVRKMSTLDIHLFIELPWPGGSKRTFCGNLRVKLLPV